MELVSKLLPGPTLVIQIWPAGAERKNRRPQQRISAITIVTQITAVVRLRPNISRKGAVSLFNYWPFKKISPLRSSRVKKRLFF
jgi:hypothetical protein